MTQPTDDDKKRAKRQRAWITRTIQELDGDDLDLVVSVVRELKDLADLEELERAAQSAPR